MLRATPSGVVYGWGYEFIFLPTWNPYGVLREKVLQFNSRCLFKVAWVSKKIRNTVFTGIADYIVTHFHV